MNARSRNLFFALPSRVEVAPEMARRVTLVLSFHPALLACLIILSPSRSLKSVTAGQLPVRNLLAKVGEIMWRRAVLSARDEARFIKYSYQPSDPYPSTQSDHGSDKALISTMLVIP